MILGGRSFEQFISKNEIDQLVHDLANRIDLMYKDQAFILIGILNGSFMLVSDLAKKLNVRPQIHFMKYASYQGTNSTGRVIKELDVSIDLKSQHVLIVEDIVDTGNTLENIVQDIMIQKPASLKVASLLFKSSVYNKSLPIDFIGKAIPDDFVIGYGMDIDGQGRTLEAIYKLI